MAHKEIVMAENKKKNSLVAGVLDIVEVIVQALIIIFLIFTFCFRVSGVVGESMEPTLQNGDWLVLSNIKYQPEQGVTHQLHHHPDREHALCPRLQCLEQCASDRRS